MWRIKENRFVSRNLTERNYITWYKTMLTSYPSPKDLEETAERIRPFVKRTEIQTCRSLNDLIGADLHFKCENFQFGGAFKIRGAMNAVLSLPEEERKRGIVTHSSGNHAQAVSIAARETGVKAHIVMPRNAPQTKKDAVAEYGGNIIECDSTQQAREETVERVAQETGATFIPPYNHYDVIAGQATVCRELLEDIPDLDDVVVPVGGGGLLSGTVLSADHHISHYGISKVGVIAGEPAGAEDAYRSWKTGVLQKNETTNTIADGLRMSLGDKTFPIIIQHVDEIVLVEDEEIADAMRLIWERMKVVVEPSAAVPLAAICKRTEYFRGKKVGVILSGGNVDLNNLPW